MEAVRVFARYDLTEEGDEENSRRKRNERVGIDTPRFEIPDNGLYLWNWFNDINNSVSRIDFNGYYCSIPPSEFLAWSKLTGNCLTSEEYEILKAMDNIFCRELNAEITSKRAKENDARKREMEAKSARVRRR